MNIDIARIIKSAPAVLGAVAAVITVLIAQADANGWAEVAQYAGYVGTWIATALGIIRVVAPVVPADRGLPTKG